MKKSNFNLLQMKINLLSVLFTIPLVFIGCFNDLINEPDESSMFRPLENATNTTYCESILLKSVFENHTNESTLDSKVAMHNWLCEENSEEATNETITESSTAFLNNVLTESGYTPETSGEDLQQIQQDLFNSINAETLIVPVSPTEDPTALVSDWREKNCKAYKKFHKKAFIHSLVRAASEDAQIEWRRCNHLKTIERNKNNFTTNLNLFCSVEENFQGEDPEKEQIKLIVNGFRYGKWILQYLEIPFSNAVLDLKSNGTTGAEFELDEENNKIYSKVPEVMNPGEEKNFIFDIIDQNQEVSFTEVYGSFDQDLGGEYITHNFKCENYYVPVKAECGYYEADREGSTPCINDVGVLMQTCETGKWKDLPICSKAEWSGDYIITNESDIEVLKSYSSIEGDLIINDSGLSSLDGLQNIESVGGNLEIINNASLENIKGLNRLEKIGGDLKFVGNDLIQNITELSNLKTISGNFIIVMNNSNLPDANAKALLEQVKFSGFSVIENNKDYGKATTPVFSSPTGTVFNGDSGVTIRCATPGAKIYYSLDFGPFEEYSDNDVIFIEGSGKHYLTAYAEKSEMDDSEYAQAVYEIGYVYEGDFYVTDVDSLNTISMYTSISGNLIIKDTSLASLFGLSNITSVGGSLSIQSNNSLTNLDGLSNITSVGGYFYIGVNPVLTNLQGLSKLTSVGGVLYIQENDSLTNLDGLSNISSVGRSLILSSNAALSNISGLNKITSVGETVSISGCAALTNLSGLNNLTSVGKDLILWGNAALTNLSGLNNIRSVGRDLVIFHNPALIDLSSLNNLSSVGRDLNINDNKSLTNISGLRNLDSVRGRLIIGGVPRGKSSVAGNPSLKNLDGLNNLASIGEDLWIDNNNAMIDLDGFNNLNTIGGDLRIGSTYSGGGNSSLKYLNGFSNLNSIRGRLMLANNKSLTDFNGLNNLESIGLTLFMQSNNSLVELNGLKNLASIGEDLDIRVNALLQNLDFLSNLISVGRDLELMNNAALTNLDGLHNITSVGRDLIIEHNFKLTINTVEKFAFRDDLNIKGKICVDYIINSQEDINIISGRKLLRGGLVINTTSLVNLNGLENLTSIEGDLRIIFNKFLTNLDAFSNLTSIGGSLLISDNSSLTNLNGLRNLTSVVDGLYIRTNGALKDLDSLINLTSLSGALDIYYNSSLTNIDGLKNITSVGWYLRIWNNDSLQNLDGLKNLSSIKGNVDIMYNNVLPTCEANNLLDQLVDYTGKAGISGNDDNGVCD